MPLKPEETPEVIAETPLKPEETPEATAEVRPETVLAVANAARADARVRSINATSAYALSNASPNSRTTLLRRAACSAAARGRCIPGVAFAAITISLNPVAAPGRGDAPTLRSSGRELATGYPPSRRVNAGARFGSTRGSGPKASGHAAPAGGCLIAMVTSQHPPGARRLASAGMAALVPAGTFTTGSAVAFLTGHDGSPPWQAARIGAVLVVTALAMLAVTGLGRFGMPRAPRWLAGPVAGIVGLVGTAAGGGIGGPYLTKTGWSAVAVAGLVALVSGLVLVVTGAATTIRATRRWWRLLVVPALLVVTVVALWAGVQAVAATNVPVTAVRSTTPSDRGLAYQDVRFTTRDGVRLSGWYLGSTNRAAVVLLHGAGSTRSDVLDHAATLARHGYGVLLFDARGHGRSHGRAMDFGWYGDADTTAAVSFLRSRPDVDAGRIAVVGMSMGGEEAIGAAAADPRIRAVVAEGATSRVAGDKGYLRGPYGWRGALQQGIERLTYGLADLLSDAAPPITLRGAVAASAPRPVLLITAGKLPDEAHAARYIQRGSPSTVQVWQVPGAGHTGGLATRPAEWDRRVSEFLATALGGSAGAG